MSCKKKIYGLIWNTGRKIIGDHIKSKPFSLLQPFAYKIASDIKSESVNVLGHDIILGDKGPLSMELSINGIWEKAGTNFVLNSIKKNDVVLDIGANIGYFTLLFAKQAGSNGKIYAFEPEPKNFQLLKKNLENNKYQNVTCENVAVSNKNDEIELFLSEKSIGQHKIYPSTSVSNKSIKIKSIKIDDYILKNIKDEQISFIKIDAEGSEYHIIEGMKSLLGSKIPLKIMLEFDPIQINDSGCNPEDLLNVLNNAGFNFSFVNSKKQVFEKSSLEDLIKKFVKKNRATNLLCQRD